MVVAKVLKETLLPTVVELLEAQLSRPDIEQKKQSDEALSFVLKLCTQIGLALQWIARLPPSRGYERWLVEHGTNAMAARAMAYLLVHRGNRIAADRKGLREIVSAIRFLAKPHRNRTAIFRRVAVLLRAWETTSTIETIFAEARVDELPFIRILKLFADGEVTYDRLMEVAASKASRLRVRRGLMISAASAAHEAALELVVPHLPNIKGRAYTWNESAEEFTDPVTTATRREFGLANFDPRPAHRRFKSRSS